MMRVLATADLPLRFSTTKLTLDGARPRPPLADEGWIPKTESVRSTVLQRDHATCRGCGFRSGRYQEVVCAGPNARNLDDLVTLCIFCAQCFRLDRVQKMQSGTLIYLPSIRQAELHWMLREVYVARATDRSADHAKAALELLSACCVQAKKLLGSDSPADLAAMLEKSVETRTQPDLERRLEGIRLLPLDRLIARGGIQDLEYNMFPQILTYWRARQGPLADVATTGPLRWLALLEERVSE